MKKYENKQVEGKVRKENKDMARNLCFHDWLIVRELKVLDDVYDDALRQFDYKILDLYGIEDCDERQKKYDKILEERETLRAIYIHRRNELKAGFTDRRERQDGEASDKGWRKSRVEKLSDIARGGYVLTDREAKAVLNKRFGCIDECAEFDGDEIFVFNKHEELKDGASGGICSGLTPEMLDGVIHDRLEKEDE